jgi:dolichol kinase
LPLPLRELLQDLLEHLGGIILATLGALAAALSGGIVLTMVVMVMMVAVDAMAALIQTMHS